jgi:hypothetical protein
VRVRERASLFLAAGALTAAVLAPLAKPGYVLAYDMVFVPRQPVRADLLAPSDSLPRAVPLDALVSVASLAVPGWLLQRVVLVAVLFLAAVGAGRLVPATRPVTRLVAAVGYAWTPYLAERLLIGHWGLLSAYAALPWLVRAALDLRANRSGRRPLVALLVSAAAAAITPTGGVIALVTTAVLTASRERLRWSLAAVAGVAVLNLPWVLAGLATAADARTDPAGVAAFAARAENWGGLLGALAGTGGIWNADTVPASRTSLVVPLLTLVLVAVAVAGLPALRDRFGPSAARRLGALAVGGLLLGSAGALPSATALEWFVAAVPGGGLLRDGQKFLLPYALVVVLCFALGAERLADALARRGSRTATAAVLAGALALPLAVLPDLAFGGLGRLEPVRYPADWRAVAARVDGRPGEVLSLPLGAYRAYGWNGGRTVLDPLPRFLDAAVLVDDRLFVGDRVVAGENPRMAEVRRLLEAGAPASATGVRWVVVQREVGGATPPADTLGGLRRVYAGGELTLYENPGWRALPTTPTAW